MKTIRLVPEQEIELLALSGSKPIDAINDAKEFLIENKLKSVDLFCFGFLMIITEETDTEKLLEEYEYWKTQKSHNK
jgi:hypothetical protein